MIKKLTAIALTITSFCGAMAQHDNMYLIKDSHVVGKYAVDDVDYVSFELPEDVTENNIWLTVDNVTKNSVTYTVNTISPNVAYAHNVLSMHDINYNAMSFAGAMFDDLSESERLEVLQLMLQNSSYAGIDTKTYTQQDHRDDGTGSIYPWFSVVPGTKHLVCAWEIDPATSRPLDTFVYTEFTTDAPGQSSCDVDFSFKRLNKYGVAFNVSGSGIYYMRTAWGLKETMELFADTYGIDFLMGAFGEVYDLDFLTGSGDFGQDIENATWPTAGSGTYVMYVRAYDADGDMTEKKFEFQIEEEEKTTGPEIRIFSKAKDKGSVEVNFEVVPSNADEVYVRLVGENWLEDRLNMGYELGEVAKGGDALDVTSTINNTGEYTFRADGLDLEWKSLLIYAADADGLSTTLRISFWPDNDGSEWSVYNPVYKAPKRKAARRISFKGNPTLPR